MKNYKDRIQKMMGEIKKSQIIEGRIKYDEQHPEKMLPKLEEDLRNRNHSLGDHPIFPESDEFNFEEKLMAEHFTNIVREVKRHFNTNSIDNLEIMQNTPSLISECMKIESSNRKTLEELAIKMVREEYDIPEDMVEIEAKLVNEVNDKALKLNPTPITIDEMEFDSHDDIQNVNGEVYKRRFINALNQGAAMRTNHMFHMVDEELTKIDPTLPTKYGKMMAASEYMYYVMDNVDNSPNKVGGIVKLEIPTTENKLPKISAEALVFPVLIHELVKGVMELLSSHGLPENPKMREYVLGKADYTKAEPWDMRLGPALWGKIVKAIPNDDFNLKHHLYADLASLPVNEFNSTMKEVIAGTKKGQELITEMIQNIKKDFQKEDFDRVMDERRQRIETTNKDIIDNPDDLDDFWKELGI